MKIYKLEVCVVDMDEIGIEAISETIKATRYPNRCISPEVKGFEERDIGEWSDDHPLNLWAKCDQYYIDIFKGESNDCISSCLYKRYPAFSTRG